MDTNPNMEFMKFKYCLEAITSLLILNLLFQPLSIDHISTLCCCCCCCCWVASVVSDSVRSHRRQPIRLPHPWDSLGKNTGVGCHFLLQCMKVKSESEVAQSCLTLSDLIDYSPPGSSVHGIFQARVLEWGAIAFSEVLSRTFVFVIPLGFKLPNVLCSKLHVLMVD